MRSPNSARFASPVSESWKACWLSCVSKALRSVTSWAFRTSPATAASPERSVIVASICRHDPLL
jgi:hypothetical protein